MVGNHRLSPIRTAGSRLPLQRFVDGCPMKLGCTPIDLGDGDATIRIVRNAHGVPEISAASIPDLMYGLGWVHAADRQLQILLTRIILQGRAAELLKADPGLIAADTYMRRINFLPDADIQLERMQPQTRSALDAYVRGVNAGLADSGTVFELRLLGHRRPEPYTAADCLRLGKAFGFLGLASAQAQMEKFMVQMIQKGISSEKIAELFPYLTDPVDRDLICRVMLDHPPVPAALEWFGGLPRFSASNNWAVSGRRTRSGFPILCGDPHLEVNRLPNVWQETVLRLPDDTLCGATIPGVPGLIIGRNRHLAWSVTYAFMDMLDYRIERCQEGKYFRQSGWEAFIVREEILRIKGRGERRLVFHENAHGILEGDPHTPGHYLVMGWSGAKACGARDFDGFISLMTARDVETAMALFRRMEAVAMNWVVADTRGGIGYQMSGRHYRRPAGISGLLPHAGWDERFDPDGFNDPDALPAVLNPPEGIIVTANQDLNYLGRSKPINLAMGPYRAQRIIDLLESAPELDVGYMKDMQYDLYSRQAERLMAVIGPLLPDTENGRILKGWDLRYTADAKGAMLFESVYRALIDIVFGDHGLGREVVAHIFAETALFNDYYANLDRILASPESAWFDGEDPAVLFRQAIAEGLDITAVPYARTRTITLDHLLFGGRLPRFMGFDAGPLALPGGRATIVQGQIFKSDGRLTTFSPGFRFIADLAGDAIHTNLAGGPSDRRFSKWYTSDLENWYEGNYKELH